MGSHVLFCGILLGSSGGYTPPRFTYEQSSIAFSEPKYKSIEPKPLPYGSSAIRTTVEMPNTNIVVRSTSHSVSPPPLNPSQMNAAFTRPPQVVTDADGNRFLLYEYTMDDEIEEDGRDFQESSTYSIESREVRRV